MNWLDVETKEILRKAYEPKLSPPKVAEFALVLLKNGPRHPRMVRVVSEINRSSEAAAADLLKRHTPITIHPDLTEEEALSGQFELICCDAISVFLRSEVLEQSDEAYLQSLFKKVLLSTEFEPTTISVDQVPPTGAGAKFLVQFLGDHSTERAFPLALEVPFKKARIMKHWAARVGAQLHFTGSQTGI